MTKKATTIGCICEPHGSWPPSPIAMGSSTVFIEGKAAARVGDNVSCGSKILNGSSTVIIG